MDTLRRGLELHRNLWRLKGMTGALLIKGFDAQPNGFTR